MKRAFAHIAPHRSLAIIGRESGETHGAGFDPAHAGSKGILLANRAGNDLLEIHPHILEEVLRQIAAVEAHRLVGIVSVIIVPVEQRAGRF